MWIIDCVRVMIIFFFFCEQMIMRVNFYLPFLSDQLYYYMISAGHRERL